ncbi:chitin deacetylase 1-like [Penaeus japonicus]|uniref:chitin deacetylase 1-like n=1 Tax=Penaeus japonicus TaxID=27405 RepID=UPI001C70CFB5|nr:chitin deacetylase 1-like [Penaeus japonicus]
MHFKLLGLLLLLVAVESAKVGERGHCRSGYLQCKENMCIPENLFCDGVFDCSFGEDETNCKDKKPIRHAAPLAADPSEADAPTFPLEFL